MKNLMEPKQAATDYGIFTANCNPSEPQYKILNIERPLKIRDQICTILTVPDIEDAERICLTWN